MKRTTKHIKLHDKQLSNTATQWGTETEKDERQHVSQALAGHCSRVDPLVLVQLLPGQGALEKYRINTEIKRRQIQNDLVAKRRKKRKEKKESCCWQNTQPGARRRLDWIWIVEQQQLTETCSIYLFFFHLLLFPGGQFSWSVPTNVCVFVRDGVFF